MKVKKNTIIQKTLLIALFLIFSLGNNGFSQKIDTIRVSTIDEFFESISSNKVILMEEGNYDITKLDNDKKTNSAKMQTINFTDDRQLIIIGVSNLKIIGIGKKRSKIFTTNLRVTVLSFKNCKNITIDNIDAGHKGGKGEYSCLNDANVINIYDSENFAIKNSILYGSGYIGIYAINTKKISLIKSTITECSGELFVFDNCMNTIADSCVFSKTNGV